MHWFLTATTIPHTDEPTDGDLRQLWRRCAHKLSKQRTPGYVFIDGLHDIPVAEASIKLAIVDLVPFGLKQFRFIFTGSVDEILGNQATKLRVKPFTLSPFNSHETDEYLQDIVKDKKTRVEFHSAFDGVPSFLASVRRQIAKSPDPRVVIDLTSAVDLDSLFEAEWQRVCSLPQDIISALAYVIAYSKPVTSEILSVHTTIGTEKLTQTFEELPFLRFSEKNTGWEFSSDLFRQFAEVKLTDSVRSATRELVSELLVDPDSDDSLIQLPSYFDRIESTDMLLDWFDQARLAAILRKQRTAAGIDPLLRQAIRICHDGKNDRALTIYSICRSIIRQISQTTGIDHEIRARSALGDTEGALAVANDVPLLTQRLRLLAVAADALSDSPGVRLQNVVDEIQDLAQRIDFSDLSNEEVIDIATDVYPIDAELAISLLRKTIQGDVDDSSLEVAIAQVSLNALRSKISTEAETGGDIHQPIPTDLLVDEKLRNLLEASTVFYRAKDAAELLESTSSIEDASERLFIQRKWIGHHPLRSDVIDVIEIAVQDAIAESQFTPNATFYREVATPLVSCANSDRRKAIVEIVEGQESVIKRKGPMVDFVRLQLILAACDCTDGNPEGATTRLESLYLDTVGLVEELETKITCLAWFAAELTNLGALSAVTNFAQIKDIIDSEVEEVLEEILRNGAEHFVIVADALRAFAKSLPARARDIAQRLNTLERRNMARLHVILAMCRSRTELSNAEMLFTIFDGFEVGADVDLALLEISKWVNLVNVHSATSAWALEQIVDRVDKCQSSVAKLRMTAEIALFVEDGNYFGNLRTQIHDKFLEQFLAITTPREKYNVACELIAKLKAQIPSLATVLFEYLTNSDQRTTMSEDVERGCYYILDLLVRAVTSLARCNLVTEEDINRTCKMIGNLEDPYRKVTLFSRLGFFFWRENQERFFTEIVNGYLWPILNGLTGDDHKVIFRSWRNGYPVIWLEDPERARNATADFPESVRNECTATLCFALLRTQPPGEPFDDDSINKRSRFSYADIKRLLQLCEDTNEDNVIFVVFDWISKEVSKRHGEVRTTRDQKAEITRRMLEIAKSRLPVASRIKHLGYRILCQGAALRVYTPLSPKWDELVRAGEAIDNAADRSFVLSHLTSYIPKGKTKLRKRLLDSAESTTSTLQSAEDKFLRYYRLAALAAERDQQVAVRLLRKVAKIEFPRSGVPFS